MLTKSRIARKVSEQGIEVVIANGKRDNILLDLVLQDKDVVCTRFVPYSHSVSSIKKWIAYSENFAKGTVYINAGAELAILSSKASSLLFVGITRIEGEFEKDDIVHIVNEDGKNIGVGRVNFGSLEARDFIGMKNKKPLIHYDYLCLNQE